MSGGSIVSCRLAQVLTPEGKLQEHNQYMAKAHGKYSLEGALMLKTHAAIQSLKEQESQ